MEIIKPLRLGVLQRPYRWQQQQHLALTVVALSTLGEQPVLLPEQELWELVDETLGDDGLLDLMMPKPAAEFLVSGFAYTCHQLQKNACAVEARVGDRYKRLTVFGDRFWIDGVATAPAEFEAMPLKRERAYGGPAYTENLLGIGHMPEQFGKQKIQRLPNIEHAHALLNSPRQTAIPAGFGMIDIAAPSHMALMGQYGRDWLQQDAPGFSNSFDWHYFNVAPQDQQLRNQDRFPAGLNYGFLNMHPELPVFSGRLPDGHARCFITRSNELDHFSELEEVPLRLTTVWFVPHEECAILIYHGTVPVKDEQASDVRHLLPAFEATAAPRTTTHYRQVLANRLDEENGDLYVFDEAALITHSLIGSGFDTETLDEPAIGPLEHNLAARQQRVQAEEYSRMRQAGLDPEAGLAKERQEMPKLQRLADLPAFEANMQRKEAELQSTMQTERNRLLSELQAQPDDPVHRQLIEQLAQPDRIPTFDFATRKAQLAASSNLAEFPTTAGLSTVQQSAGDSAQRLRQLYLHSVAFCGAAPALPSQQSDALRAAVVQRYRQDRDLSDFDLTGADLSHLDLTGARMTGALLESANLEGTRLDGADLGEAILARTRLKRASLRGANCRGANLSHVTAEDTSFAAASFADADWQEAEFHACDFNGARFEQLNVQQSDFNDCTFLQCEISDVEFLSCSLLRPRFDEAQLHACSWIESVLEAASFESATLDNCSLVETDAISICFARAKLVACYAVFNSNLEQANFESACLLECNLRDTRLTRANMINSRLNECDLSGAQLQGANLNHVAAAGILLIGAQLAAATLVGANLMDALLRGADLRAADLRGAHLFGADLALAWLDASTVLDKVHAERVNLLPRRDHEVAG
jgi:uncharacterized protein YjbI with pentapeptide repeats